MADIAENSSPRTDANPLRRAVGSVVGFILPQSCVHCRREGPLLCADCHARMELVQGVRCPHCAERIGDDATICSSCAIMPPPLDRLASVYRYHGPARSAVLALKFRSLKSIADTLASSMAAHDLLQRASIDCIVPVPAHPRRLRERGYNQAALLANYVAKRSQLPCLNDAIRKVRHTPSQVELDRFERSNSVRGAFATNYDFTDAHVLLIDDVATTGSTLMSCASALKHAGSKRVSALTFAKEMSMTADDAA